MTALQQQFLSVLRCALAGQRAEDPGVFSLDDCAALLEMAQIHKVLPLIFEAIYHWPVLAGSPLTARTRQTVRRQVYSQTMRTGEFLQLNSLLTQAGLQPMVVKGLVCRDLYPRPDHRPSGDEDLLIPPGQFEKCRHLFTRFGLLPCADPEQDADSYEIPYRKPGSLLYIELHKSLFPPQSDAYGDFNALFADAPGHPVQLTIQGSPVWTLEYTDHLLYLICHAFKHFLHSGVGIRQLCDIILFANRYGNRIQWDRIVSSCRQIRAEKFAVALFRIGEKHLCFDPDLACYPEKWRKLVIHEQAMLEDLLEGGLYGDNTMSRKHSSNITLDAVAASKQGKKSKNAVLLSLFPPAAKIQGRYPYLKDKPWLLPAAWCSRILTYRSQSRNNPDNTPSDALKIGKNRVALLKQYGIIP